MRYANEALQRLSERVEAGPWSYLRAQNQERKLVLRELTGREDAGPKRIVDVMVDVRHAVDDADDLPLESARFARACVMKDPVAHLGGQVETSPIALEKLDDPE